MTGPKGGAAEWFAVYSDGRACAAYPTEMQAKIYASRFSNKCEIVPLLKAEREAVKGLVGLAEYVAGSPSAVNGGFPEPHVRHAKEALATYRAATKGE